MKIVRYAKLNLGFDEKTTQSELRIASGQWRPHLNTNDYTGEWDVLPLRSPGGSPTNIVPELLGEKAYADTLYMHQFPSVKALVSSLKCPVMSVRFLNLRAGAIIKQHKDHGLAFEKGEARLHFPVITNPGVEFYCEDERVFLNEGDCWYLNANLNHRVRNNSSSDRIHLVIDCKVDEWLAGMIRCADKIAYKKEPLDENLLHAIKHLRAQNTGAGNKLADELEEKIKRQIAEDAES